MNFVIETRNLTKKFGDNIVVDNLDLCVPRGKIYGLLGRNGAGKTTTMQMLLNLIKPSSGDILLFENDYKNEIKSIYSKIGSLIENPGFYNNLTAYENLKIISNLRDHCNDENIINALKFVGLNKQRNKTFRNYSMGMKQRLGIAASIMHNPQLLILDEPSNGLDPIGINEIRKFLLKLSKEKNITILISSHVLSEIEHLADIIGVMNEGCLIDEVNMKDLYDKNEKYVEFIVSDNEKAIKLLKNEFQINEYSIHENNSLRLYESIAERGRINQCFVENDILVSDINLTSEKLENYFSNLIMGNNND